MIKHHILPEEKLIVIRNWGQTSIEEVATFVQFLRRDPFYSEEYDSIVDNSQIEHLYTLDEIITLTNKKYINNASSGKTAMIAPSDAVFGISRMHQMMTEVNNNPLNMNIFRNTKSALIWLDREELDIEPVLKEIESNPMNAL